MVNINTNTNKASMNTSDLEQDRLHLHAAFRKLGYTTNGQTEELMDLVFDYLVTTLNAVYEQCAQTADETSTTELAFIGPKIRALKLKTVS